MYNIKNNNYYENEKSSTVYTPTEVSQYIYDILSPEIPNNTIIFDPCVGQGSLLIPWRDNHYTVFGDDVVYQGFPLRSLHDYLTSKKEDYNFTPGLVLINPPFNKSAELRKSSLQMGIKGNPLMPEVFLLKTIQLFGNNVRIVLFTPYGLRLNNDKSSRRLGLFTSGKYPRITSMVSLPKDIYSQVKFHSEILMFNTTNARAHYFFKEDI